MASSEDIPDRFWKILEKDQRLRDTWEGRRCDLKDQTRSGYDMSFAQQLARYDFTPSEIASIMRISPSGKRGDATERYLEHTIAKTRALTGDKSKYEKKDKVGISLR